MITDERLKRIEARANARIPDDDLSEEVIELVAEVRELTATLRAARYLLPAPGYRDDLTDEECDRVLIAVDLVLQQKTPRGDVSFAADSHPNVENRPQEPSAEEKARLEFLREMKK
jgi:hypothetical protein